MARQGVIHVKMRVFGKNSPQVRSKPKSAVPVSKPKGVVTVRPYTRVVNGKTVSVGGYSYKRKA